MPICIHCGYEATQCRCTTTHAEDIFFAVDGIHQYKPEKTEPEKDAFFKEEDSFDEGCDFDYLDFNNDWED